MRAKLSKWAAVTHERAALISAHHSMCRIGQYGEGKSPSSSQELAQRILTTVYMGTEVGRARARAGQERVSYRAGWVDGWRV